MTERHYASNLLSVDAIETLNAARTILKECEDTMLRSGNVPDGTGVGDAIGGGYIAGMAMAAGSALFDFLNVLNSYGHAGLSEDQLHNRRPETARP